MNNFARSIGLTPLNLDPPSRLFADDKIDAGQLTGRVRIRSFSTNAEQVPWPKVSFVKETGKLNGVRNSGVPNSRASFAKHCVVFSPNNSIKPAKSGQTRSSVLQVRKFSSGDLNLLDTFN